VEGVYDKNKGNFGVAKMKVDSEEEKNDNISHFICRLAYCRLDELKKWFITQETRLFFYRLEACNN